MRLNVGDVFLAINPGLSGPDPHYHIVVHKTPEALIVVTYTTTNIEEARRHCQRAEKIKFLHIEPSTLVLTGPADSDSFDRPCAINCNHVQLMPEGTYTTRRAFKILSPIKNRDLIDRIKEGIKNSLLVEEKIIKLL